MEWNIHQQGRQYNGTSRDGEIPLWIVDEIPDDINIVVFTEFNCHAKNINDFYEALSDKRFSYSTTNYSCAWSNDILIAVRGKEIAVKAVSYIKAYPDIPNTAFKIDWEIIPENLRVDINIGKKDIHFWGIRIKSLGSDYKKRKKEMETVLQWLKGIDGINVLVGDFNNLREDTPEQNWNLSVLDSLIAGNFERKTPLNHSWGVSLNLKNKTFEKDWKQYGAAITRATMANWVIHNSEAFFLPMYEYFHRKLLERGFAMADETPLQVLHEPGRRAQTKSYMWLFRSGEDGGQPIVLYKYSETRAGDNAVDFLHGFKGYLMCDGYSGYNKVPDAKRTACWAHIRRYLTDAIPKGKELDYAQPSVQGIMYINQLFHLEDVIKAKYTSFDAIKKARLEKEKPIVEGFLSWLDNQSPVRGSRMDKAVTYIQNRRPYLATYLEDGRCSFSNNLSENAIRPFTVGRKNWLFCDTPNGAQASAIVYTMVEMAKANGVNVYHYLTYLLEKLPNDRMSDEELELLAPWNENVKAEIKCGASDGNQSYVNCQDAPAAEK